MSVVTDELERLERRHTKHLREATRDLAADCKRLVRKHPRAATIGAAATGFTSVWALGRGKKIVHKTARLALAPLRIAAAAVLSRHLR